DLRQGRRLADALEAIDGRASAHGGADGRDGDATGEEGRLRHDTHSRLRDAWPAVCDCDGALAPASSSLTTRGVGAAIVTWPGPVTVPWTVRLDCRLSTLMVSPWAPPSTALPRRVSSRPGAS